MLNDFWVFISCLMIFIGLVASEGLLLVVGSLVLVLSIAARIWERFAFRSVTHSRSINRQRAFIMPAPAVAAAAAPGAATVPTWQRCWCR